MAFELIPFPISIIFIFIFEAVALAVLWKLRKKGRVYRMLFNLSLIISVIVLALFIVFFASTLL